MIQGTANSSSQKSLGFETLARFAQLPKKVPESSRSDKAVQAATTKAAQAAGELTPAQQQEIAQLRQTDTKVRAHEQAHISVGADLIRSGPSFSYTTGPDNKRYAVSGEVSIDTSPGRTPEETIPKAQHIRATALAPADPSPQDNSVAALAGQMEGRARQELSAKQLQEADGSDGSGAERTAALYRKVGSSQGENTQLGGQLNLFA